MALTDRDAELLARVAEEAGLPIDLMMRLACLEEDIPDLSLHGAKSELNRRVTEVLNAYATPGDSA